MRAAAPIRLQIVPDRGWGIAVAGLGALAALSPVTWLAVAHDRPAAMATAAALLAAAAGAWAARRWLRHDCGELAWSGAGWQWRGHRDAQPTPVQLSVALDLGPWMLLRLRRPARGGTAWLAVSQRTAAAAWAPWRAAVYSRAPPAPRGGPES